MSFLLKWLQLWEYNRIKLHKSSICILLWFLCQYKDISGRKLQNDDNCTTEKLIFDDRIIGVFLFVINRSKTNTVTIMSTVDRQITMSDTHKEKLCFTQFKIKNGCLAASDLFQIFSSFSSLSYLFQLSSIHSIIKY